MRAYILKRLLSVIPILFVVFTAVFLVIHLTPGDPIAYMLGEEASQEQIDEVRDELGLNDPLLKQYLNWIVDVFKGDLGNSYFVEEPVTEMIFNHIGPTIELAIFAQIIGIMIAIPLGIMAARYRGTIIDQSFMGLSLVGISVPSFILGLFFILFFAVKLQWLPVAGYEPISNGLWNHFKYLIMPGIALGAMQAALIARMTRSSMLDTLARDYIKTARAKGVKDFKVIFKHALRNALLPILTVAGQSLAGLITGAVVVETIFNIPGIGQLMINSISRRDFSVIQGTVLYVTFAFVFINLIVDVLYGFINPRVRLDRK